MPMIDPLPSFKAEGTAGTFDSDAAREGWLVLYFYPKDNTSACTREACEFTAALERFAAAGARVVGVSRDSVASHKRFAERQGLRHELLADTDEALCALFDVIKPKVMYGKPCRGVVRSTFLYAPGGKLAAEWRALKVPGHVEAVLAAIKAA
ncbi:MAG: peroxiredoxin [Duodenibacillus sp.]|nr:peroxiredoxin [Duodenibacillus sp.]